MKTLLKIIAGIVLLLILLAVCVALYVRFVFDPNDLRNQITKQVQDKTGRELLIEGDLKISTFPWVSASIGRTTLSDDPAFGSEPLLTFESVSASVKLLPLLKKQLELGTTSIDGGRINLVRLADGTTNWNVLLDKVNGDMSADTPETESGGFETQSLGAIAISDATVVFKDQLPNAEFDTLTLSGFNMSTGELKPGATFDVDLVTRMDAARVGLDVAIKAEAELHEDWLGFEDPRITVKGSHYSVPFEQFEVELSSDTLKVGETTVDMGEGSIDWTVSGGREAAKDLTGGSGSVKTSGLNANGDNFTLASPDLDYSFDFG
ncbi:MAG: AsmA family protein, partial [Gammaproteobacteria bacterium]